MATLLSRTKWFSNFHFTAYVAKTFFRVGITGSILTISWLFGLSIFASSFAAEAVVINTQYEQDRFYVVTPPINGLRATMLLDSGGSTGIYPEFAWYWKTAESRTEKNALIFGETSPLKDFPQDVLQKNSIRLMPSDDEEAVIARKFLKDGVIGNGWLGTRKWNLNYPAKKLALVNSSKQPKGNKVALGFKNDQLFYPRMSIMVDGESLDVLFDTGATSFFNDEAMKALSLKEAFSASSFIRESVFESWKTKHPDWKVIEGGDRMGKNALIRVPTIKVAGYEVGPIWFAKRPNKAYDEFMSQYMDCKCAGAVGGNVLRHFDITIDYPTKTAWFLRSRQNK